MKKRLFLAAAAGLLCGATAWAQTDARPLPRWRLEVLTYGSGSSSGLYRHLGGSLDLGLNLGGQISKSEDNSEQQTAQNTPGQPSNLTADTGKTESRWTSLSAGPEVRKWAIRTDRLSVYYGATATSSYRRTRRTSFDPDTRAESTREMRQNVLERSFSLGLGATLGASLHLADHLAVLISLSPASFSYSWRQEDLHYSYRVIYATSPTQVGTEERYSTRKSEEPSLRFGVSPGLFVTLDF